MSKHVLITGQFWDTEFADLINQLSAPTTLIPCERLEGLQEFDREFGLVILAQNRRESVSQKLVDQIAALTNSAPIINLLGSLCEGQERSGTPLQNTIPVYWHQWQGRFDQLIEYASQAKSNPLHTGFVSLEFLERPQPRIGISALCETQKMMLDDGLRAFDLDSVWLEQSVWNGMEPEPLDAICIDCDSHNENLAQRLTLINQEYSNVPKLLVMNFPRKDEVETVKRQFGIAAVVSKPFSVSQLGHALSAATGIELVYEPALPERFRDRSNPKVEVANKPLSPTPK